ncbi:MAG: hypothetical protein JKY99_12080 [Rhizobiales bacterium]|nr:hypothetical protein [Hyphomicrobiales bacterium]
MHLPLCFPRHLERILIAARIALLSLLAILAFQAQTQAQVQSQTGRFLNWLNSIDQHNGANAWAGSTRYNADGTFTASDVTINIPAIELVVHIDKAVANGLKPTFEPGFNTSAQALLFSGFSLRIGETEFATNALEMSGVLLPDLQFDFAPGTSPFAAKVQFLNELLGLQANKISLPKLYIRKYAKKRAEQLAEMLLTNTRISELKHHSLKSWRSSKASLVSPPIEPLIRESYKSINVKNLNFQSLLRLFDGKQSFNRDAPLFTALAIKNYVASMGGMRLSLPKISIENLNISAPDRETEKVLTTALGHPKGFDSIEEAKLPAFALELASLVSIGALRFEDMRVSALGIEQFDLVEFSLKNASLASIDAFNIAGFGIELEDIGGLNFGKFAFSGLKLPSKQSMIAMIAGKTPPISALLPTLSSLVIKGFYAQGVGLPSAIEVAEISMAIGHKNSSGQEALDLTIDQLKFPASLIPARGNLARLKGIVDTLELKQLEFSQQLKIAYDAATRKLIIAELTSDLPHIGKLSVNAVLAGLSASPFADPTRAMNLIRNGQVESATVRFDNDGVVEAGFDAQAKTLGTNGKLLRGQVGATLPFLLGVLQNPEFQKQLATALQAFLPEPEGITVALKPASAVSISDVERQLRSDPRKLITMLGVSIHNEPKTVPDTVEDTKTPAE